MILLHFVVAILFFWRRGGQQADHDRLRVPRRQKKQKFSNVSI